MSAAEDEYFDPKKENLSYTIAIIKPHVCISSENIQFIFTTLEENAFIIKSMIQRILIKQEIENIFYRHLNEKFFLKIQDLLESGESLILLLCHETEDPIQKWKKMIGPMNPETAKKDFQTSLRAKYGIDLFENGFHGSDNSFEANKERDIFKFAIPQKIPDFKYDRFKVPLDNLLKFIFPPNLEHPSVNERIDIFATYGPGVSTSLKSISANTRTKRSVNPDSQLNIAPIRLLDEEVFLQLIKNLQEIWNDLCIKCKDHCSNFLHLASGRNLQHILSDQEIKLMGEEMNKNDLIELLSIEKGKAALSMIETVDINVPEWLRYTKDHVLLLLRPLTSDYYNRYDFNDLSKLILEDRRIRLNNWVSELIKKPINRFLNPNLIDKSIPLNERNDIKSKNFTLTRINPLTKTYKKESITQSSTRFLPSIIDKPKLSSNEFNIVLTKKLHRYTHNLLQIGEKGNNGSSNSVFLLREYNSGKHGSWDNYCCYDKKNKGSYVNNKEKMRNIQEELSE